MYDFCRNEDCKAPLQHTVKKRDAPRQCSKCRHDSYVVRLKNIQKECLAQQVIVPEETVFKDEVNIEDDSVIYKRKHVQHLHMQSTMSDMSEYNM